MVMLWLQSLSRQESKKRWICSSCHSRSLALEILYSNNTHADSSVSSIKSVTHKKSKYTYNIVRTILVECVKCISGDLRDGAAHTCFMSEALIGWRVSTTNSTPLSAMLLLSWVQKSYWLQPSVAHVCDFPYVVVSPETMSSVFKNVHSDTWIQNVWCQRKWARLYKNSWNAKEMLSFTQNRFTSTGSKRRMVKV